MRAVLIAGDLVGSPGGAGTVTQNELLALKQVHGEDQVGILQLPDVRPEVYACLDVPFLWDYFALSQLHDPRFNDLVHAHIYSGCYSETVRYLKSRGVKTTYTCPAHNRYDSKKERNLRGVLQDLPHIDGDRLWRQHKIGLLEADLVIAPSTHSGSFLTREGVERLKIIPHGIESVPDTIAPYPEEFTVGYLGALGPDKGIFYLIDAWGHLDYPNARLIMAGPESERLGPDIQGIAATGRFHLTGFIPNVADFYNSISVYCQPSVAEGFGIEVLEAMSYGRPVVCSTGAGACDLVEPGVGWRVVAASTEALMDGIKKSSRMSWRDSIDKGRSAQKMAAEFTWEKMRAEYVRCFREVLNGAG